MAVDWLVPHAPKISTGQQLIASLIKKLDPCRPTADSRFFGSIVTPAGQIARPTYLIFKRIKISRKKNTAMLRRKQRFHITNIIGIKNHQKLPEQA